MKLAKYCFLVLAVFITTVINSLAATGLEVILTSKQDSFLSDNAVNVSVKITNRSKESVTLLKWKTPLEAIGDNLFSVTLDGKEISYLGPDVKRGIPIESDYIILSPKESISKVVNLADYYDLSITGNYQIKYSTSIYESEIDDSKKLESSLVNFHIQGRPNPRVDVSTPDFVNGNSTFSGCTAARTTDTSVAREFALYYAIDSANYLNSGLQTSRYTEWFGAFNSTRYSNVTNHFVNIRNALDSQQVSFDCGTCPSGPFANAYAYVFPNSPYTIYLCNLFWNAPLTGTDSKAGTLIHETSHFTVVAGTGDTVYGQAAARNLANTNPASATNNADNHEYFAEASTSTFDPCASEPANCGVTYRAHVAGIGWLNSVQNGAIAGTTGQGRQMEAIQLTLNNVSSGVGIEYRAHVGGIGWQGWVSNGATSGTTGQGRRMEAVEIRLTNAPASCHVYYQAHVAGIGWQNWVMDGTTAGTTGQSRQMEAIKAFVSCP
jgi:peptidyl-Lys metalloendopeptidase